MYSLLSETIIIFSLVLLIIVTCIFLVAQIKSDNSIMDIAYGPIFTITGLTTLLITQQISFISILVLSAIGLWSLRLGIRIYRKNKGAPEDARYAAWRSEWKKRGDWYFILRSYIQINFLQGLIILLVASPLVLSLAFGKNLEKDIFTFTTIGGLIIFLTGLAIEALADYQLDRFIARKKAGLETAVLMKQGLFRYSRRPNYFGETLIWWGLAIITLPLPFGYLGLISPIIITYIVTRITGPMLEKLFLARNGDEYRQYMRETSYFIPLPPRLGTTDKPLDTVA